MAEIEARIRQHHGNLASVAKSLGVTRQSILGFCGRHERLATVLKEARESMLDNAESALYRAVLAGEAWATCFFLKTQAKHRGYIERQEIDTGERKSIVIIEEIIASPPDAVSSEAAHGPGGVPQ